MTRSFFAPGGLILGSALFFLLALMLPKPQIEKRTEYIAPPIEIKYLTGGFQVAMADSFWLRAVQDFDYCEQKDNEGDCKNNSWLFQVLNLVTELDRRFEMAYMYGGLALTVLVSDSAGASVIYDRGVSEYPKSWPLLYTAAYHAMAEEQDKSKASRLYYQAFQNGAPSWTSLLAGRLAAESGETDFSRSVLRQMQADKFNPIWIKRLEDRLKSQ